MIDFYWSEDRDAQLMEMVSNQVAWECIARKLGISLNAAKARFQRLRKYMGYQAT